MKTHGARKFLRRASQKIFEIVFYRKPKIFKNNYLFLVEEIVSNNSRACLTYRGARVDIIVPVYNAYEYVVKCINSVLINSTNCRLIIIDDASTDERISDFLDELSKLGSCAIEVLIIKNKINIGFVKSVNKAYDYVKNHFVILNSDTEVPPNWIERLFWPIFQNESVAGSVTPFSNAATICSFPLFCEHSDIFNNLGLETLDKFFMEYGNLHPIEIPTGIGFCMAFNKSAVERIGLFNEIFGEGYGEENDWSMRAAKAGYKNYFVTNLFVYHKHSASFGLTEREALLKVNDRILEKLHKDYFSKVRRFIHDDPIKEVRETLAMIIDSQTRGSRKAILIFDHLLGGGANTYSDFLSDELLKKNYVIVFIRYDFRNRFFVMNYKSQTFTCSCNIDSFDFERKRILSKILAVDFIFVNNIVSWPDPISHVIDTEKLGIPYLVFLHDYFLLCPSWNLLSSKGKFCDVPECHEICKECLKNNKISDHHVFYKDVLADIDAWRKTMSSFLRGARALFSFSQLSAMYFRKAYGQLTNMIVNEHTVLTLDEFDRKPFRNVQNGYVNIGVLGSLGYHKGMKIIEDLINDPRIKKMDLRLIVFGNTARFSDGYKTKDNKFMVYGRYDPKELGKLLLQHEVTFILIPSIWPETFSFTTSEAIMLGYPVICFNLGAQAERIHKFGCGLVVEDISADGLARAIENVLKDPKIIEIMAENTKQYVPVKAAIHLNNVMQFIEPEMRD